VLINPARNPSIFRRRFPIRLWYPSEHLLRQSPLPSSQFESRRRFPNIRRYYRHAVQAQKRVPGDGRRLRHDRNALRCRLPIQGSVRLAGFRPCRVRGCDCCGAGRSRGAERLARIGRLFLVLSVPRGDGLLSGDPSPYCGPNSF
jgi:hypothetical protein